MYHHHVFFVAGQDPSAAERSARARPDPAHRRHPLHRQRQEGEEGEEGMKAGGANRGKKGLQSCKIE